MSETMPNPDEATMKTTAGVIAGELLAKELIASKDYDRVRDILFFHARADVAALAAENAKLRESMDARPAAHANIIDELSGVKVAVIEAQGEHPELRKLLYQVESALASARACINDQWMALAAANKRAAEAEAVIAKLPKTADGVPIVPGMEVWCDFRIEVVRGVAFACPDNRVHVKFDEMIDLTDGGKVMADRSDPWVGCVYSTRAAALAAKGNQGEGR